MCGFRVSILPGTIDLHTLNEVREFSPGEPRSCRARYVTVPGCTMVFEGFHCWMRKILSGKGSFPLVSLRLYTW